MRAKLFFTLMVLMLATLSCRKKDMDIPAQAPPPPQKEKPQINPLQARSEVLFAQGVRAYRDGEFKQGLAFFDFLLIGSTVPTWSLPLLPCAIQFFEQPYIMIAILYPKCSIACSAFCRGREISYFFRTNMFG